MYNILRSAAKKFNLAPVAPLVYAYVQEIAKKQINFVMQREFQHTTKRK